MIPSHHHSAHADPVQPGPDEITVTRPESREVCSDRGHRALGVLAAVTVTFGQFGSHWNKDAFWPEAWGRTYPLCEECWAQVHAVVRKARPGLVIRKVPSR